MKHLLLCEDIMECSTIRKPKGKRQLWHVHWCHTTACPNKGWKKNCHLVQLVMQTHSNLLLQIQQTTFYPAILTNLEITPVAVTWTASESTVNNQHYFVIVKWQWSGCIASRWAPWSGPNSSSPAPHSYLTIQFTLMLHQLTLKSGYNTKIQYATLPALHANSTNILVHLIQRHTTTKCQRKEFWFL